MAVIDALSGKRHTPASGNKATAAVVLLHGYGSSGDDLIELAPFFANTLPDAVFYAPHAPTPFEGGPFGGYQWFSLRHYDPETMRQDSQGQQKFFDLIADGVTQAALKLNTFLDQILAHHELTADRLALIGFSQGTMMSLHAGLRRKERLGGIVGFSGALISPDKLGGEIKSKPPVVLVHGTDDPVVPVISTENAAKKLTELGVDCKTKFIPGLQHGIDNDGAEFAAAFLGRVLG